MWTSTLLDEIGYLSYSNRHADLLFEIVSRRYQEKSTLITTNRPFAEWGEVFPNAACVVSLVDRLVHNAEIIQIEGEKCCTQHFSPYVFSKLMLRCSRNLM